MAESVLNDLDKTMESPAIDRAALDLILDHDDPDTRDDGSEPRAFTDPNDTASRAISLKLLAEILDFQQRLDRLAALGDASRAHLIAAYRKSIRVRRQLLRELPSCD